MYKLLVIGLVFLLGFYFIYKSNDIETFMDKDNSTIAEKCPDVLIQKGAAFFLYNSKRANVPGINPIRFESLEEYVEFTDWQRSQGILCPVLYLQHAYNVQGEPVYKARPSPLNMQAGQPDYIVTTDSIPGGGIPSQMHGGGIPSQMHGEGYPSQLQGMFATQAKLLPPPANVPVDGIYGNNNMANVMPLPMPKTNLLAANNYPGFDPQNQTIGINTPLDKMFSQTIGVSPNPMDDNWGGVEFTENLVKSGFYKDNEVSI